jgi:hypothetical protein
MEIVFFKSKELSDYYLLFKGADNCKPENILEKLTSTGSFSNSGYPIVELSEVSFVLKTDTNEKFFDFLAENIATNHIDNKNYNGRTFKAWYEFKSFEPVKWLDDFKNFTKLRNRESVKNVQLSLF